MDHNALKRHETRCNGSMIAFAVWMINYRLEKTGDSSAISGRLVMSPVLGDPLPETHRAPETHREAPGDV
jgi:hypothetical protein